MRIAVWHNLPSGGAKRALYYHVRGLVEKGHSVEAWCPSTSDRNYLALNELVTEHVVPLRKAQPDTAQGLLSGEWQYELRQARVLDEHCRRCADEINRREFDILFANSSIVQAASSIGRYVRIEKVLYLQEPNRWLYEARADGLPWIAIPEAKGSWMRPRYLGWFLYNLIGTQRLRVLARDERLNASAFDSILVNSYFSRETLLRVYGLDSTVCYLGVDTDLFTNRHCPRENFVVGMGEMSPHKNVEFLIKAIAQTAAPRPHLVWIANSATDWYHEQMRNMAESYEVTFRVRTRIDDTELVDTLNRATAMVYAPRLEPFGLAPLEANACGLPVIAVAEGGVRETIVDGVNGLLVPYQPHMMAQAIQRLTRNKQLANELGENGAKIVQAKWSVTSAVKRLEEQLTQTAIRYSSDSGK